LIVDLLKEDALNAKVSAILKQRQGLWIKPRREISTFKTKIKPSLTGGESLKLGRAWPSWNPFTRSTSQLGSQTLSLAPTGVIIGAAGGSL
jgi:hypothetical protein